MIDIEYVEFLLINHCLVTLLIYGFVCDLSMIRVCLFSL
jgi:hypothetical protein